MNVLFDTARFDALGTRCAVRVACSPLELPLARMAATAARAEIAACERVLSRFDPSSDLSRVNAAPGEWTTVDSRLVDAIDIALWFERETDGKCSPLLLTALIAAGYDRTFARLVDREAWSPDPGGGSVELDRARQRVRVSAATLDLGATAKGLIGARALHAVQRSWPGVSGALVDLGGDVAVVGTPPTGDTWLIDVDDPRDGAGAVGTVRVAYGGVATSGPTCRRFGPDGALHHLIDPITRVPAVDGPLSATVAAGDLVAADAHATALAITPVDDAAAYLADQPGLGAVLVLEDGPPLVLGTVDFVPRKELVR